jgi:hypothetical protein
VDECMNIMRLKEAFCNFLANSSIKVTSDTRMLGNREHCETHRVCMGRTLLQTVSLVWVRYLLASLWTSICKQT